jgi:hypothetical protein
MVNGLSHGRHGRPPRLAIPDALICHAENKKNGTAGYKLLTERI